MIYLDYSANFPVREEVLQALCETERDYRGNVVSVHPEGDRSKKKYEELNAQILSLLRLDPKEYEIVYTSSASESNNLAIKGIYESYLGFGKHILVSEFEHSSCNAALGYLKEKGADVEFVSTSEKGMMDLGDFKAKLRQDTILVVLSLVESEAGAIQDYQGVERTLKDYPHAHFLLDATQAVGKIPVEFGGTDLVSFAPHKFGGVIGTGVLVKKKSTVLTPLIHGGHSVSLYRSGTTPLGLIASTEKALELALSELPEHLEQAKAMHGYLLEKLKSIKDVQFNSTSDFPYIVNISLGNRPASLVVSELASRGICVSQKSACSIPNTPSKTIFSIYHNRARALSSFRISLSYLTKEGEIDSLIDALKEIEDER